MPYQREPSPPQGGSSAAVWLRKLLAFVKTLQLKTIKGGRIIPDTSGDGYHLIIDVPPTGGLGGWHWAATKTYDYQSSYSKDEVVVVLPGSFAVTDGLASADYEDNRVKKATPGLWVALQRVTITPGDPDLYHVPQWYPPVFGPEDPDHEDVYWWPISFYPVIEEVCTEEGPEWRAINMQPSPVDDADDPI